MTGIEAEGDQRVLQLVRVRLPRRVGYLYVMRQFGGVVDAERFPGAEPLFSRAGRVLAALGPQRLVALNDRTRTLEGSVWPTMLILDVRRTTAAVQRPIHRWSPETRGNLAEFDDLCWDAAATSGDDAWAAVIRDPGGAHQFYNFVWGLQASPLPGPAHRRQLLIDLSAAFVSRLEIVD